MSAPLAVAMLGVTLALALPVAAASNALEAEARAAGAADAAALAASDAVLGWVVAEPCGLAAALAEAAQVSLVACEIDWESGQVRVITGVQTIFGTVHSRAHAGPPVA